MRTLIVTAGRSGSAAMANLLRIAMVDSDEATRSAMQRELVAVENAWLEADCERYDLFGEVVDKAQPDVALVAVDGDPALAMGLIQQLCDNHPNLPIVAVSGNTDGRFVVDLLRMGVRDVVAFPPRDGELSEVFARLAPATSPDTPRPGRLAAVPRKVIALAGARGGVGCTSLAVNLGSILAQEPNHSVVLVDLDLFTGDAHVCLDLVPRSTLFQVVENIDNVDAAWLKRALTQHETKLSVLPHPEKLYELQYVQPDHVGRVVTLLKRNFTHVLLDLSKSYSPVDVAALEAADEVLLMIQLDMSSVVNVLRLMESLATDHPELAEKVKLVANRVGSEGSIPLAKAKEALEREIAFQVPNDVRTLQLSRDSGKPLCQYAPGSKVHLAIQQMAQQLAGRNNKPRPAAAPAGASVFGKLFARKG